MSENITFNVENYDNELIEPLEPIKRETVEQQYNDAIREKKIIKMEDVDAFDDRV